MPERVGRDSFYARYPTIARKIPSGSANLRLHATRRGPGMNPWPVLQHFCRDAGREIPYSSYFRMIPGSHHVVQSGNPAKSRKRAAGSEMYSRPPPPVPRHRTVRACPPATSDTHRAGEAHHPGIRPRRIGAIPPYGSAARAMCLDGCGDRAPFIKFATTP